MPVLDWIGKEAVVNHDKEVPFRLLKKVKAHSVGGNSQNLIIHGDNLEALKALMPYYSNRIKCIYIDPPYNTGNEKWIYNDKVNSPKITKWLGKVVGGEAEDLCRHDKWLCMMYPRLKLLREFLTDDGVIFISIDDNEFNNLKSIMDELFGSTNHIETIIWKKRATPPNDRIIGKIHEYILCYSKSDKPKLYLHPRDEKSKSRYSNPNNDPKGKWVASDLSANGKGGRLVQSCVFPIKNPVNKKEYLPPKGKCWLYNKEKVNQYLKEDKIGFRPKSGAPFLKRYLSEVRQGVTLPTILLDHGNSQTSALEQKELFEGKNVFEFPKPTTLIKALLTIATKESDFVLDSFSGSGTTGHAVLDLNKDDGKNRKFILVEMEDHIKDITAERIRRAINKYKYNDGFEFCQLDKPLFDEKGQIEESCTFKQLATYIYFTETQTNIDKKNIKGNFIGEYSGTEYHLIFKEKNKNVLTQRFLKKIEKNEKRKVIYADTCLISDEDLKKKNTIFKQIPYEVERY